MEITYNDFVAVCPSAMTPETEVFNILKPQFDRKLIEVRALVTDQIFASLDNIEDNVQHEQYERLCNLKQAVIRYVCASVFYEAIPHLDLVLTATGFGVVSNQNVAPASADRVVSLRKQVRRQECAYLDEILDFLRPIVDWSLSRGADINSLFWHGSHVRVFGIPQPTRDDLTQHLPEIRRASETVKQLISPEQYEVLLSAERNDSTTSCEQYLIDLCRAYIATLCIGSPKDMFQQRQSILRLIESHPEAYAVYHASPTYQSRHIEIYENKKDDTCFFFG